MIAKRGKHAQTGLASGVVADFHIHVQTETTGDQGLVAFQRTVTRQIHHVPNLHDRFVNTHGFRGRWQFQFQFVDACVVGHGCVVGSEGRGFKIQERTSSIRVSKMTSLPRPSKMTCRQQNRTKSEIPAPANKKSPHVGQVPPGGVTGRLLLTSGEHSNNTTRFVPKHRRGCHVEHGLRPNQRSQPRRPGSTWRGDWTTIIDLA
ncbi:hypothetical protein RB1269 [Rhodopirellula baltica SH 1]|uniref:Uncharacterized protein n=1 Tax=Rhodopirellula baltica (strain DSM 10527 / NCIMB 13988 / SH1) TaxID=243090 RepID=Q7UXK6_RHOBA|nr:hypothetical protein RB1269 [Rhodopirellula baltica SH 1]